LLHQMDSRMPELELSKLELPDFCGDGTVAKPKGDATETAPPEAKVRRVV